MNLIKQKLQEELDTLNHPILPAMTLEEHHGRIERIARIKNLLTILNAIDSVIHKRRTRGASELSIEEYKNHLIRDVWKNSDMIKDFILTLK